MCYNPSLVHDKLLEAPAFVTLVYGGRDADVNGGGSNAIKTNAGSIVARFCIVQAFLNAFHGAASWHLDL